MNELLLYLSIKYNGNWEKIFHAIERKDYISNLEFSNIKKNNIKNYITIVDKNYPNQLKSVYKPPFILFFKGNISLLKTNTISLFGDWNIKDILDLLKNNKNYEKNVTFIINFEDKNIDLINDLNKRKINFISIKNESINDDKKYSIFSKNNLIISEFFSDIKDVNSDQLFSRISIGISKKVLIKYKEIDIDVITGLEIGRIEEAKLYYYKNCNSNIINSFNLIRLSNISKIFLNKN